MGPLLQRPIQLRRCLHPLLEVLVEKSLIQRQRSSLMLVSLI